MPLNEIIRIARPGHWVKNIVVLLPVVFGMQMSERSAWLEAGMAAVAFCFASSFGYIINDIKDRSLDRNHPVKKDRPLASGRMSLKAAVVESLVFGVLAFVAAFSVSGLLLCFCVGYILLQVGYTYIFKQKALVDVICIAMGFVLRAAAGAVAIRVAISPWLFICMFTICLFMGFCKRYNELVTIGDLSRAGEHRNTLIAYTPDLLTHLITISAAIAVVAFLFYGLTETTIKQFGTNYFVYTLPLVVYAVFRFAMLSMKGSYMDPTDLILHDRPFQATVIMWMAAAVGIILWGSQLADRIAAMYDGTAHD